MNEYEKYELAASEQEAAKNKGHVWGSVEKLFDVEKNNSPQKTVPIVGDAPPQPRRPAMSERMRSCPAYDETIDPCPRCGATVAGNDRVNGVCQADFMDKALGDEVEALRNALAAAEAETAALRAKLESVRTALAWYASPDAWTTREVEGPNGDYGKRAQSALEYMNTYKET